MLKFTRWIPAILIMGIIFLFSSASSSQLPDYGAWDMLVKKGGHMTGYALLAAAFWYGFRFNHQKIWFALGMALLYAMTDEFHQTFSAGRHPSLVDVFLFDGMGAAIGLSLLFFCMRKRKK